MPYAYGLVNVDKHKILKKTCSFKNDEHNKISAYALSLSCVIGDSSFIPRLRAVKLPPQNSAGAKKLGGSPAARKRPIGEG
ncbi:hypothetical protein C174_26219 [Bacillus mycoides FSL H7-687]|nr:hypothetical protein C174_26219 [Bacillus mycoides FSL H7-687]